MGEPIPAVWRRRPKKLQQVLIEGMPQPETCGEEHPVHRHSWRQWAAWTEWRGQDTLIRNDDDLNSVHRLPRLHSLALTMASMMPPLAQLVISATPSGWICRPGCVGAATLLIASSFFNGAL
jgi:hypothetical protein